MFEQCQFPRWRGVVVLVGGLLTHISFGTVDTFANMVPYVTAYIRERGDRSHLEFEDTGLILASAVISQSCGMCMAGHAEKRLGPILTSLIGSWTMSMGLILTYWSLDYYYLTILTYGSIFGYGLGFAYFTPLHCAMKWFPERKGFVNGLVVSGYGCGAFIFTQVQKEYINPDNLKPEHEDGDIMYFDDPKILDRVPRAFLVVGFSLMVLQLIGSLLLCSPPFFMETEYAEPLDSDKEQASCSTTTESETDGSFGLAEVLEETPTEGALLTDEDPEKLVLPQEQEDDDDSMDALRNYKPKELLRSANFYLLWSIFFCNGIGLAIINILYKAYGFTITSDDTFLSLVGSFASIFNAAGRLFFGMLTDRCSFRTSMLLISLIFGLASCTFRMSEDGGKALYFIYVCVMFFTVSGSSSAFPTASAKCFGRKHVGMNYAMVYSARSVATLAGSTAAAKLRPNLGWNALFFFSGSLSYLAAFLAFIFRAKDRSGKQI